MKTFRPPHHPLDVVKLTGLIETFRAGNSVSPIVANGENAITGSHRIAAHRAAWIQWDLRGEGWENTPEPVLDVVECTDEEYTAAIEFAGLEPGTEDYNALATALYETTDNDALKAALEDQIGY